MTKKNIKTTSLLGLSMVLFSSCLKDMGNTQTVSGVLATVVSRGGSYNNNVIIQLDGAYPYYYAEEFLAGEDDLEFGERIFLNTTTVNWDEQQPTAVGSFEHPIKMTAVDFEYVDFSDYQDSDEELQNDSLSYIHPPLVCVNRAGTYMTFSGSVPTKSDPEFRLIRKESRPALKPEHQDTAVFELKTKYTGELDSKKNEGFVYSFNLNESISSGYQYALDSAQIVVVEFTAKGKATTAGYVAQDSTYTFMGHRVSPSIKW